jgi:glycosyltransferase involved in cell wall biosynthesis
MISVVIPAYNEEEGLPETLRRVRETLERAGYVDPEVIVVDDGSSDATARVAQEGGARVLSHPHNLGYGYSVKDGIEAARHDVIALTDADGTYPVEEIPALVEQLEAGYHMVVGARTGKHYRQSNLKAPLRMVLKWLVEFTAGRRIPDINSGLRVFRRGEAMGYFDHLCNTFSFTTSLTLAFMMTGKFVAYRPIAYAARIGATKVRLFKDSLRTLQYIVQAILYYNPLKIFLVLCLVNLAFAVLCAVIAFLFHLRSAFLLGIGAILMSVLVFALGLLADLLKQIMDTQRRAQT